MAADRDAGSGERALADLGRLAVTTAFAILVTEAHELEYLDASLTATPFSLIGVALGIFLGFRNNTSYQRFWEGRIL